MNYKDGQNVALGDKVEVDGNRICIVVGIIPDDIYSDDYPRENWCHFKEGILVESENFGLYRLLNMNYVELLEREPRA
jgi:hypothetical protein